MGLYRKWFLLNGMKYSLKLHLLNLEGGKLTTRSCDLLLHNNALRIVLLAAQGLYVWDWVRCCAAAPGQRGETPSSAPMSDE